MTRITDLIDGELVARGDVIVTPEGDALVTAVGGMIGRPTRAVFARRGDSLIELLIEPAEVVEVVRPAAPEWCVVSEHPVHGGMAIRAADLTEAEAVELAAHLGADWLAIHEADVR